jgi:hypothetical protein
MGPRELIGLKGWGLLPATVLLVLSGLIGISSMRPATTLGTSAADHTHRDAWARGATSSSICLALVNGFTTEQVDPAEDSDQAPAPLFFPSPAPVEASPPPALGLSPLARSPFVDSTAARGPPSA